MKVPKPGAPIPSDRKTHRAVEHLVKLHNKAPTGILISSDTVIVKPLADGRYSVHLHPDIVKQFKQ